MEATEILNSYLNVAEPVARRLLELARAQAHTDAACKQAAAELEVYLERFDNDRLVRDAAIRELAESNLPLADGELEMDPNAVVSEGDDNGAYVMTWSWVSFADTA